MMLFGANPKHVSFVNSDQQFDQNKMDEAM